MIDNRNTEAIMSKLTEEYDKLNVNATYSMPKGNKILRQVEREFQELKRATRSRYGELQFIDGMDDITRRFKSCVTIEGLLCNIGRVVDSYKHFSIVNVYLDLLSNSETRSDGQMTIKIDPVEKKFGFFDVIPSRKDSYFGKIYKILRESGLQHAKL